MRVDLRTTPIKVKCPIIKVGNVVYPPAQEASVYFSAYMPVPCLCGKGIVIIIIEQDGIPEKAGMSAVNNILALRATVLLNNG